MQARRGLDAVLWGSALALAVVALKRIAIQSYELVAGTSYAAAFDLRLRYVETARWLAGSPVYSTTWTDYPPASYAILGPLIGHLDWPSVRVFWLVLSLASLAVLSVIAACAVDRRPGVRALAAVLPWAAYGSALTLGVGQLGLLVLATGLGGVLLARRAGRSTAGAALAGLLFAVSLVKPTLTAPWFWLLALASWPPLAACIAVLSYCAATLAASAYQPEPLPGLMTSALANGRLHTPRGYGNVANWAVALGHGGWIVPLGLAILAALGIWVLRHRETDVWVLLGVSAFVSRFFTYHYYVDDLLILVPMIALLRLSSQDFYPLEVRRAAAAVFALTVLAQLTPTRLFTELGPGIGRATEGFQIVVWLAAAAVLLWAAGRGRLGVQFTQQEGGTRE